ncbi:MAG: glutamine-hydrolyzing carbamoyl-phosphate synthase small subunit [Firmicutes bacterium]|nr:glutamine-hydrolyzing carbamoyl-phosphate synthase small subunit [Bacillota bacterium]
MKGKLYLEDGSLYEGIGFGSIKTCVGELVFQTGMTGYQKILTDPSYSGQIINMTYPILGNYGINGEDNQSDRIYAQGLVCKEYCKTPSNYRCEKDLDTWLKEMDVPGVSGIDTRKLTKKIRKEGTIKCVITTEDVSVEELKKLCDETILRNDYMKEASWAGEEDLAPYVQGNLNVAVLDFGIKRSILEALQKAGCNVKLFPYGFTAEEVMAIEPDGVFLSNGPGDPAEAIEAIGEVRKLMEAERQDGSFLPMFGICMGHQILALAAGGETYQLKYGHRGSNHGVYSKETGRSYITSQNHGFAVKAESLMLKDMEVTEINLNDRTVEGMAHRNRPVFSVQYHPEAGPGPKDGDYLFGKFVKLMKGQEETHEEQ